ncbi:alpha/beta fold hydrolase [Variovorax sp. Root473]|uniref:alpha/beta fold hydrolase n=1 Tax=Variovorax sp. Root473 TaxID=1736541 RepID=UPI0006F4CFA6|nr:alpha/beta hydrolase [Variovorax sp. Root473]KQX93866.1 hydrolase [Variovorax sp. Root473]
MSAAAGARASSLVPVGTTAVTHRTVQIDGVEVFYRAAGPVSAPVLLLPHGYPCSSFQFRALMPALADRWRVIAPDFPGFGYSGTPKDFAYDFDGYAHFLDRFAVALELRRYALYLHDYGSQIGLRHAILRPGRICALIIQNGDIHEDTLGPKYAAIQAYWNDPSPAHLEVLERAVSEEGFRHEFVGEVSSRVAPRLAPDLWRLHWRLMDTPARRGIALDLMKGLKDNLQWFGRYQEYLRTFRPPTLIVWGPQDGYMPLEAGRAYLRDLPDAEFHVFDDGGHWLLETHLAELLPRLRDFLGRHLPAPADAPARTIEGVPV